LPIRGARLYVRFAVRAGGKEAARDDWDALPQPVRANLQAFFEHLAENGTIRNPSAWKKLGGYALWQLRKGNYRILCCWRRRELLICKVVMKNAKLAPKGLYDSAQSICEGDIGEA